MSPPDGPAQRSTMTLWIILPGLLVAATGIGAGDLATAAFAGSRLGLAVLWAVIVGAAVKFVLNEGLARWQLVTGETILEGVLRRFGKPASIAFLLYLVPWSFFVGAALMSACGATAATMLPVTDDPVRDKIIYAVLHSAVAVALVWFGSFRLFGRLMALCIGTMFVAVVVTAIFRRPDPLAVVAGLAIPHIPQFGDGGLVWTIALAGGVGGTLTIICYGYWIREEGRDDPSWLRICRIDLITAYAITALFGLAMIVIAAGLELDGTGVGMVLALAEQLENALGIGGRWLFLIGAWAAVFSSLLGVWQSVPYVFADFVRIHRPSTADRPLDTTWWYRAYLIAIATIPMIQISHPFREVQKVYAVMGAAFIPLLACALLVLNGRRRWIGEQHANRPITTIILILTIVFFIAAGYFEVRKRWS